MPRHRLRRLATAAAADTFGCLEESIEERESEDDPSGFSFVLEFAAAKCPQCDTVAEPGPCPKCGAAVEATPEIGPAAAARSAALQPLASRIELLGLAFAEIDFGSIPITADQMVTAVVDADLFEQVSSMMELGYELGQLNLNDPEVIGRKLRRTVAQELGKVERLLDTCRLLGRFDAPGPASELRVVSIEAGAYGVSILEATVATLVAPSIEGARHGQERLQELLNNVPFVDSIGPLLSRVEDSIDRSVDARIGRALGRPGNYSDDLDQVDLGRVFSAFSSEENPFEVLGCRAAAYFSHLLPDRSAPDPGLDAMLILPAVGLASLDRPLLGHRVAELVADLFASAWATNPAAVQTVIDRTSSQGEIVFAAAGRIERALRLLQLAAVSGQIDDATVIQIVMDGYLELSEGAYRVGGWLVRDLSEIAAGDTPEQSTHPPMLASLAEQLEAAGAPAAQLLAAASDSRLRNAKGHAQYRWDAEKEQVEDLRTGDRWSADELERSVTSLVGTVLGVDAGLITFLASGQPDLVIPPWLAAGRSVEANTLMAQLSFGGFGFEVIDVLEGGRKVVIRRPDPVDKTRLMAPTAGLCGVIRGFERIAVVDQDGGTLLDVSTEVVAQAQASPENVRELASVAPLLDDAEASGVEPVEALNRVLLLQVAVVGVTGMQSLVDAGYPDPKELRLIEERLAFVLSFARGYPAARDRRNKQLLDRVNRCRTAAFAASRGQPGGFDRLAVELPRLVESAVARGVHWPPF